MPSTEIVEVDDAECSADEGPISKANEDGITNTIISTHEWKKLEAKEEIRSEQVKIVGNRLVKCIILKGDDFIKELKAGYIELEK